MEGQTTGASGKKPKGSDGRLKGQSVRDRCAKCGQSYEGGCRIGLGSGFYKCGKVEHFGGDCTASTPTIQISDLICFHCNQNGHKKANCPRLTVVVAPEVAPTPATARVVDGRKAKLEAPVVRS